MYVTSINFLKNQIFIAFKIVNYRHKILYTKSAFYLRQNVKIHVELLKV